MAISPRTTATHTGRVLSVTELHVAFSTENGKVEALKGITFDVKKGEILAIVGESGSGKSVAARAALGLLPRTAIVTGSIELLGRDLLNLSPRDLQSIRGRKASMIFQEPASALDPVYRVGDQLVEALMAHGDLARKSARERAIELLNLVGIPDPAKRIRSYPHQLSGGQQQRVMIAMAIALDPPLIIADEPTTALDVTVQASIMELLRSLRDRLGISILLISHNMGVVADLADRIIVMNKGEIVEDGEVNQVFAAPVAEYTRTLLAAVPRLFDEARPDELVKERDSTIEPALRLDNVTVTYPGGFRRPPVKAVKKVNLEIAPGEILGLVGESGSGKSTLTKAVLGLVSPASGQVRTLGVDPAVARGSELTRLRRNLGMVFQDPRSSLNPRMTLGEGIAEPLAIHKVGSKNDRRKRTLELLDAVQLPSNFAQRFPHELSGGQRQRASLARALSLSPKLVLADEPTSALDVSVQAAVLELFLDLQREFNFACLFITHDLAVVGSLAHRLAVMRYGEIVELGSTREVLHSPRHAYTRNLINAVPLPDPGAQALKREARAKAV
ncbi:ABC transporter ATP-binding protein [Cryobacterium sp. Y82]|uniref:ABC transporter ATP-binding protein n=1 Tax=Cryobacterium sp. Y82 TaxID=2045017 RepID=UPI000CE3BABB|nr:ABC transporter ATP-binding protein [Cryobacterium sp. Y82]